ncbi:MAG: glycosyltransferase family 39 protein [Blastochloris sp.]|nr:glycosyltransferase family 39 protein [Blastochloris sp.]
MGKFLPVHEGWFSYYGWLMNQGAVPYRDFYFFTQPLSLWISQFITSQTDLVIAFRWYGLLERLVITILLFILLRQFFSNSASFWGTVTASFVYASFCADAYFSYLNTCLLFVLLGMIFMVEALRERRGTLLFWLLAGWAVGMAFLSKQSNGLIAIGALIYVALFIPKSWNMRAVAAVCLGIGLALLPLLAYLGFHGTIGLYWSQVFVGAAESKGNAIPIMFGFLIRQVNLQF